MRSKGNPVNFSRYSSHSYIVARTGSRLFWTIVRAATQLLRVISRKAALLVDVGFETPWAAAFLGAIGMNAERT